MRSDFKIDAAYNFSSAKSFSWTDPALKSSVEGMDKQMFQLVKKTVKESVTNSLNARGYSEKISGGDLIVHVDLSTYSKTAVNRVQLEDDYLDRVQLEDDYLEGDNSLDIKRAQLKVTIKDAATKAVVYESEVSDLLTKKRDNMIKVRQLTFYMMKNLPKN